MSDKTVHDKLEELMLLLLQQLHTASTHLDIINWIRRREWRKQTVPQDYADLDFYYAQYIDDTPTYSPQDVEESVVCMQAAVMVLENHGYETTTMRNCITKLKGGAE